jgi:predicted  nucleic acid-binding Zn-ribbon protein
MTKPDALARHIELLHAYHLDLWSEVEAQLRVLRSAQDEIAKLRDARTVTESRDIARDSANMLARHVQTLKGRVGTLRTTVEELDGTVGELVKLLAV